MSSNTALENIIKTIELVKDGKLEAHPSFLKAELDLLLKVTNGCGAAGAKFDFVPDKIWGLLIIFACIIHDWDYYRGKNKKHKRAADIRFLINMILITLDHGGSWWKKTLRVERACHYFLAVTLKGDKAFFAGKTTEAP